MALPKKVHSKWRQTQQSEQLEKVVIVRMPASTVCVVIQFFLFKQRKGNNTLQGVCSLQVRWEKVINEGYMVKQSLISKPHFQEFAK